jgi:hypothetical protein
MTANWHELKAENRDLAESNSVIDQSLYGWWMPRDQLTLYGTVMQEDFGLMGPSFQNYATDTKTWTLGGSYQFGPQTFGDLSYTKVVTNGFLGADDRVWAVGLSHHWHSGARLSMDLAIDSFRTSEDTPTLDYEGSHAEVRFTPAAF